jgi:hypothetical protein
MATTSKWTDVGAVSLVIAGDASSPTLKALPSNGYILGAEVDPGATSLDQFATYRLKCRGTTITKGVVAKCWYVLDVGDGALYDDTSATNTPDRAPDFVFYAYGVTAQQEVQSTPMFVSRPPHPFKILIQNTSGVAWTNVNDDNQLHESTFNDYQA